MSPLQRIATAMRAGEDPSWADMAWTVETTEALLAALEATLAAWRWEADQGDGIDERHVSAYEAARAAIAKARGES
jgi:hypothetical protein